MECATNCSWAVVLRSLCYLAIYDFCTWWRRSSGPRTLLFLAPLSRRVSDVPRASLVRSVDVACALYVRRATCFHRSAVLSCVLRRHGLPAAIVVGYRQPPFESHAWVELGGEVIGDHQAYKRRFRVLDVMPSGARS